MACQVEIFCFGNELLIGKILNTNARWLSNLITSLGGEVKRITVVGDDIQEISSVIKQSISRKPSFIITTGGLGPTYDDKTLEAISKTLKRPLQLNDKALQMIKERYKKYGERLHRHMELTPARIKMAKLPKGSEALKNREGTAPGVYIKHEEITIVSLPGVPREMKKIFEESIVPIIRTQVGNLYYFEVSLKVTNIGESSIAPLIDETIHDHPQVYIKSHPKNSETGQESFWVELHLSTTSKSEEDAKNRVEKTSNQISKLIIHNRGKVDPN
jgi:molybdenum cofactor synthesis domain-containing protein